MDQPPEDLWLSGLVLILLLASIATWAKLFSRWRRHGALLDYEPRSPVPWGAPAAMLAVVFVVIALASPNGFEPSQEAPDVPNLLEISQRFIGYILFQTAVICAVVFVVAVVYRADQRDFGLPPYADALARDVGIGMVACLAALAPVYGVQRLMLLLFGPSEHPLVEMVTGAEPNVGLVLLATITAVVVAPISEEILFRLLLQGWLEKREDRRVRVSDDGTPDESTIQAWKTSLEDSAEPLIAIRTAQRGVFGLPYGWAPILISSLLFAAAHYGYGPDPVAIFFLAIILGYIYQRTHRIVPCIVAHALFNSLAMLVLWRMVFANAD